MAETQTPNYKWIMPDIGGDASNWGNVLNQTTAAIDSVVYANQQAGLPIGSVAMFAGPTPPTNWLICDGSSLATTGTYAALFAIIGYAYGGSGANFNLPNLGGVFPLGVSSGNPLGQSAGSYSVSITLANLPPHAHPIADVAHNHGVNQWYHSHAIATGGHSHAIHTGGHSHSLTQSVGLSYTVPGGAGSQGVTANAGPINTNAVGDLGGNTDAAGNLGGNTDGQTSAISLGASGTGLSTTQNVGSGTPISVVPKYVALNFIIRYQ